MEKTERCNNCYFYVAREKDPKDPTSGECKRFPPVAVTYSTLGSFSHEWLFPRIGAWDWCGEWKALGKGESDILSSGIETKKKK